MLAVIHSSLGRFVLRDITGGVHMFVVIVLLY